MKSSEAKKTQTQSQTPAAPAKAATLVESSPASTSSSSTLTHDDLKILKAPFPRENLGVKVQSTSKDRTKALLVLYLQHTDVQDRLEQVDPAWTTEVLTEERQGDTVYVRLRMTVKGVSRENVGEGGDPKGAYSDALKRCAMLFGVGRYLYDSPTVWAEYNEQRDRFRQWSIQEYERAQRGQGAAFVEQAAAAHAAKHAEKPAAEESSVPTQTAAEKPSNGKRESASVKEKAAPGLTTQAPSKRSRDQLNRILMNLYRPYLTKFPETRFVELLQSRYTVGETRLMTVEQIEDLVSYMEKQIQSAA